MNQQSPNEGLLETFLKVYQSDLGQTLDSIPWYLARIIEERAWESKVGTSGHPYASFEQWVTDHGWWGLRTTVEHLLTLCESRPDVQALIRAEVASTPLAAHGAVGNGRSRGDGITSTDRGTSQTYLLKRLRRDFPDAAERVVKGESAHAVAVELGILPKSLKISERTDISVVAKRIREAFGDSFANRLKESL